MEITKKYAESMVDVYEWSIAQFSDVSIYGPPTRHVFYMQFACTETRSEMLIADLERLAFWRKVLRDLS